LHVEGLPRHVARNKKAFEVLLTSTMQPQHKRVSTTQQKHAAGFTLAAPCLDRQVLLRSATRHEHYLPRLHNLY
jgi:hypothetical protein